MSFAFDGLSTDELFFSRCTVPLFKKTIYSFNFSFVWVFRTLSCFGPLRQAVNFLAEDFVHH